MSIFTGGWERFDEVVRWRQAQEQHLSAGMASAELADEARDAWRAIPTDLRRCINAGVSAAELTRPAASRVAWRMLDEATRFAQRAARILPLNHAARKYVDQLEAFRTNEDADAPTLQQIIDALQAFRNLKPEEKATILNGWRWHEAGSEVRCRTGEGEARIHMLELSTGAIPRETYIDHLMLPESGDEPIRLQIAAGTAKRRVLKALREFANQVEGRWGDLIDHRRVAGFNAAKEKSGTPKTLSAAKPASESSEKGKRSAAA